MLLVAKTLLVLLLLVSLLAWLAAFWRRQYLFEPGYREIHYTDTDDGWRLALYRYPPSTRRFSRPVILCHGLGANRFNFDLGPEMSLARYLRDCGFEVWSLDLRGRGRSRLCRNGVDGYHRPSVFDDYVRQDAPAAIRYVKRHAGAEQVHWIGHSMGGLILYALLQGQSARDIASGTAVASPGNFEHLRRMPVIPLLFRLLRHLPRVHQSFFSSAFAPLLPFLPRTLLSLAVNPANMEPLMMKRAVCHLISDMTRGEALQFSDWIDHLEFRTFDRSYSYEKNFRTIRQPLHLMAGTRDYLAPCRSVAYTFDCLSHGDKKLTIFGKRHGHSADYGHGDLLVGKRCKEEVYPVIAEWVEAVESK